MISAALPIQLKTEFARSAEFRREQELFAKSVERRLAEKRETDRVDTDLDTLNAMVVVATEAEITAFQIKLDRYDAVTVEALMENERMREVANARLEEMLGDALVLPDGRRVFKSKSGQVFDEFGAELGPEEIDPDLIEAWRPPYEDYALSVQFKEDLDQERAELLEFQERVDHAREQIEADDLAKQDLDVIERDLEASMPLIARKALPDYQALTAPDVRSDFAAAAPSPNPIVPDLTSDLQHLVR